MEPLNEPLFPRGQIEAIPGMSNEASRRSVPTATTLHSGHRLGCRVRGSRGLARPERAQGALAKDGDPQGAQGRAHKAHRGARAIRRRRWRRSPPTQASRSTSTPIPATRPARTERTRPQRARAAGRQPLRRVVQPLRFQRRRHRRQRPGFGRLATGFEGESSAEAASELATEEAVVASAAPTLYPAQAPGRAAQAPADHDRGERPDGRSRRVGRHRRDLGGREARPRWPRIRRDSGAAELGVAQRRRASPRRSSSRPPRGTTRRSASSTASPSRPTTRRSGNPWPAGTGRLRRLVRTVHHPLRHRGDGRDRSPRA